MQVQIKAFPASGFETFGCAGRRWPASPVTVTVTDNAASDREITPAQFAMLSASPRIAVIPIGGATASDLEVANVRATLAKRESELTALRADLSRAVDALEDARRSSTVAEEAASAKIAALTEEIGTLRNRAAPSRK